MLEAAAVLLVVSGGLLIWWMRQVVAIRTVRDNDPWLRLAERDREAARRRHPSRQSDPAFTEAAERATRRAYEQIRVYERDRYERKQDG